MRPGALTLAALPPLSLYVHLPWCLKKCPYCDFNSHEPARRRRRRSRVALRRRAGARPRAVAAVRLGPARPHRLHRRRHAEPVRAGIDRAAARRDPRPPAARARLRDHARGESRDVRARALPRLSRGRRDAPVDRRAELRRRQARRARPRPRRGAGARRGRRGAGGVRDLQPRPDVRAAGADARRVRGRPRRGARVRAAAPLGLPPDDRAEHLLRALPAACCPTPTSPRRCSTGSSRAPHRRASSATRSRPSRGPVTARATTSTTGSSATTSASAPARTAS